MLSGDTWRTLGTEVHNPHTKFFPGERRVPHGISGAEARCNELTSILCCMSQKWWLIRASVSSTFEFICIYSNYGSGSPRCSTLNPSRRSGEDYHGNRFSGVGVCVVIPKGRKIRDWKIFHDVQEILASFSSFTVIHVRMPVNFVAHVCARNPPSSSTTSVWVFQHLASCRNACYLIAIMLFSQGRSYVPKKVSVTWVSEFHHHDTDTIVSPNSLIQCRGKAQFWPVGA